MTNDEKKTLLQQRYAELDDESLCALERHKLTEQARELFDGCSLGSALFHNGV